MQPNNQLSFYFKESDKLALGTPACRHMTYFGGNFREDLLRDPVDLLQYEIQRSTVHVLHSNAQLPVTATEKGRYAIMG